MIQKDTRMADQSNDFVEPNILKEDLNVKIKLILLLNGEDN